MAQRRSVLRMLVGSSRDRQGKHHHVLDDDSATRLQAGPRAGAGSVSYAWGGGRRGGQLALAHVGRRKKDGAMAVLLQRALRCSAACLVRIHQDSRGRQGGQRDARPW
jgi:hypothetical protein